MDKFIAEAITKLIKLEKTFGARGPYHLIDPEKLSTDTLFDIQMSAREMGKHIGMGNYLFIIHAENTKEGQAGEIHLSKGKKTVDITIDLSLDKEAKLTTLAHEITHKYLDEFSINISSALLKYDLEILTDIASIYLGFGKLMLIGCETIKTAELPNKTRTTTRKVGYLNRQHLAFVYLIWGLLNGLDNFELESGLDYESRDAIHRARQQYQLPGIDQYENFRQKSHKLFEKNIAPHHKMLAEIERDLKYIQGPFSVRIVEDNKKLHSIISVIQKSFLDIEHSNRLSYLNTLDTYFNLTDFNTRHDQLITGRKKIQKCLADVMMDIQGLDELISDPEQDFFTMARCPLDNVEMKFPAEKLLKVKCPHCGYQFMVMTKKPVLSFTKVNESKSINGIVEQYKQKSKSKKKRGLLHKIFITEKKQ